MDPRLPGEYGLRLTMMHCIIGFMAVVGMTVMYHSYTSDMKLALNECIEDIQNNCRGLYDYAVMLEEENARLNRLCK